MALVISDTYLILQEEILRELAGVEQECNVLIFIQLCLIENKQINITCKKKSYYIVPIHWLSEYLTRKKCPF